MTKFGVALGLTLVSMLSTSVAEARGERVTVAVAEFKNESGAGWWRGGVGWELSGMLSNELVATRASTSSSAASWSRS
jgi:hypothetical protein